MISSQQGELFSVVHIKISEHCRRKIVGCSNYTLGCKFAKKKLLSFGEESGPVFQYSEKSLLVVVVPTNTAGRDGLLNDLVGKVVRQRIVMRELHMVGTAGLSYRIEL